MSKLYVTNEDFKIKLTKLKNDVLNQLKEQGMNPSLFLITTDYIVNGVSTRLRDLRALNYKGLVLEDNPVFIHYTEMSIGDNVPIIRIVVNISELVFENELNLPDTPFVFYSYSGYLKYLTDKFKERYPGFEGVVKVRTKDKFSLMFFPEALKQILTKADGCQDILLNNTSFEVFELYQKLPTIVKEKIDKLVYPITLDAKDVSVNKEKGVISITIDKKSFVLEHVRIKELDDIVSNYF